jgi:hypothetical protein
MRINIKEDGFRCRNCNCWHQLIEQVSYYYQNFEPEKTCVWCPAAFRLCDPAGLYPDITCEKYEPRSNLIYLQMKYEELGK